MTDNEAIRIAFDIVGEGKPNDYAISPASHAEEFRGKAPDLASVLSSSAVIAAARQYENKDQEALAAQNEFRRVFDRANATVLATCVLIALVLVAGTLASFLPDSLERVLLVALSLGGVVAAALASRDLFVVKQGQLLEDWMSKRASAETARLDYFDAVANSPASAIATSGVPMELLKLEYFRRFQLDIQLAFYRERGIRHRHDAARTLSYSSWAIAGAAIAAGSSGVLGIVDTRFAAIAALGTIFAGLSSFSAMREAVYQDRRNAERYERTSRVLADLYKRLDDVRKAVCTAGAEPLNSFVEAVNDQVSLEHRQWLGEQGEARGAFARLENTLKEVSSRISPRP